MRMAVFKHRNGLRMAFPPMATSVAEYRQAGEKSLMICAVFQGEDERLACTFDEALAELNAALIQDPPIPDMGEAKPDPGLYNEVERP